MGFCEQLYARLVNNGYPELAKCWTEEWPEDLFIDFKRSADDGSGTKLHQTDRGTLGKAVSGFANSEGGILIWGVNCSKNASGEDFADSPHPLAKPKRFASWLTEATARISIPQHTGVQHYPINDPKQKGMGYVVSLIPPGPLVPYRNVTGKFDHCAYFIRAGSSFEPTPHGVLAGQFGRQPQPRLQLQTFIGSTSGSNGSKLDIEIGFVLRNVSAVFASEPFLNASFRSVPGPDFKFEWMQGGPDFKKCIMVLGSQFTFPAAPSLCVTPLSFTRAAILRLVVEPDLSKGLDLHLHWGCRGSVVQEGRWANTPNAMNALLRKLPTLERGSSRWHAAVARLLSIPNGFSSRSE